MMEGWREWHGLTRTAATKTGREGEENMLVFYGVCLGTKSSEQGKNLSPLRNATAPLNKKYILKCP